MKKIFPILIIIVIIQYSAFSQDQYSQRYAKHLQAKSITTPGNNNLRIDQLNNIPQSIVNVLFGGCLEIYNLTYTGPNLSIGYFVDESGTLGVDSGIIMTTGLITDIQSDVSYFASNDNGYNGDALLETQIPGYTTFDASIIEFDFVPLADSIIGCKYVFASEEYPEYVCSSFNDVFGFFITGPNPSGAAYNNKNLSFVPGTNLPVAINSVNNGTSGSNGNAVDCTSLLNSNLYIDNQALSGQNWCYDGYTIPFTITCNVIPNEMYHFKIAIADAGDGIYDSGVFLKGGSFLGNTPLPIAKFTTSVALHNKTVTFINTSQFADRFEWDLGDGTISYELNPVHQYLEDGSYIAKLYATNVCTSDTFAQLIGINAAGISENSDASDFVTAYPIDDGLFELSFSNTNSNENISVLVIDANGKQLLSRDIKLDSPTYTLDLRDFANGIYFLKVIEDNNVLSLKLFR
jgi:PKD repeat protein